jgi:hypothetical protein
MKRVIFGRQQITLPVLQFCTWSKRTLLSNSQFSGGGIMNSRFLKYR